MDLRRDGMAIRAAALRAVEPGPLVRPHLSGLVGPVWVYGAGKAAVPMARAVEEALGDAVVGGLVVAPAPGETRQVEVRVGAHPVPDVSSVDAGRRLWDAVAARAPHDQLVGVWSGGASALVELPAPGVTLEQIRAGTRAALAEGTEIRVLNALRRSWSRLKGGGLARAGPARWRNLVLSDVEGDDPADVGSGPAVLLGDGSIVVGSNATGLRAMQAEASALRYVPLVLDRAMSGPARAVGERLAAAIHALPPAGRPPMALLLGGEVVVAGVGAGVRGGRMQELALAAAVALDGAEVVVVATSSDGVDGAGAAGAWIDGHTASRIRAAGIDPMGALDRHDAGAALAAVDALLPEAPTGTNVRDWVIALVGPTPFGGC